MECAASVLWCWLGKEIMPRDLSEPVLLKVSQPNYLLPN